MSNLGTTAIILAGGKGSRMYYQDKAWVRYAGKPLIEHVITHIQQDVDHILISRAASQSEEKKLDYHLIRDEKQDFQGPLAGIASCVPHIETDNALVLPCDTPILPKTLVSCLVRNLADFDVAVASSEGIIQPLIFAAKSRVLYSIQPYLESGERSAKGWLSSIPFIDIDFGSDKFENINETSQLR